MTATEARQLSESVSSEKAKLQINAVDIKIKNAATNGNTSIGVGPLLSQVIKDLESRGFKVRSDNDVRDGDSWTTISW